MLKISFAVLSYVVFTMTLGVVWNLFIFRGIYVELGQNAYRSAPIMSLGMAAMLAEALALSALFYLFHNNVRSLQQGVSLGLLAGVFSMTYASLVVPAKFSITPIWQYVSLELLFGVIHYSAVGLIYALIFRKKQQLTYSD